MKEIMFVSINKKESWNCRLGKKGSEVTHKLEAWIAWYHTTQGSRNPLFHTLSILVLLTLPLTTTCLFCVVP